MISLFVTASSSVGFPYTSAVLAKNPIRMNLMVPPLYLEVVFPEELSRIGRLIEKIEKDCVEPAICAHIGVWVVKLQGRTPQRAGIQAALRSYR